MLPFNTEFQTGESKITQIRLSILLQSGTLLNLTEEHVMLSGFTRDSSTTIDGKFTVGAAVTGKLTATINNIDDSLSPYDFRGAEITAFLGGQLSDGTFQLVKVGIYTVDEYSFDGSNITLSGYDNLVKFDQACKDSSVTFPQTIRQLVDQACFVAGVNLANTAIPNESFSIVQQPKQWDTMTWHDVIAYCAQIACCYVKVLPDGRLFFSWYPEGAFASSVLDGGTFRTTTTPYSDGDIADGGDFTYTDTDVFDGGSFSDREDVHVFGSIFDISVDTDDVLITGVSVSLDPTNNINATDNTVEYVKTLGTTDYVIRLENNPLIETTSATDTVCAYLYNYLVGMRFRPLNASILENPAVEAGDSAIVVGKNGYTYNCFLSHVTYTTGAATSVSCDAESTLHNLRARYTEAEKSRALAQRTFQIAITNAEQAMQTLLSATATTMGLYMYTEQGPDGGTIYTFGNKSTLATSNIRWRFSSGALMVSSDYGVTWNGALSSSGIAVLQEIYAVKVNADNIVAGSVRIGGNYVNADGFLSIKDANNVEVLNAGPGGAYINYAQISDCILGDCQAYSLTGNTLTLGDLDLGYNSSYILGSGQIRFWDGIQSNPNFYAIADYNNIIYESLNGTISGIRTGSLVVGQGYIGWTGSTYGPIFSGISFDISAGNGILYIYPSTGKVDIQGGLKVHGTKERVLLTSDDERSVYCYETASPFFGDIGSAEIGQDGLVLVDIEPLFQDMISDKTEYFVFLQNEGSGESYISEKHPTYFIIKGTPGLRVAWELKGRQVDYNYLRMERNNLPEYDEDPHYDDLAYEMVMAFLDNGNNEEVTA